MRERPERGFPQAMRPVVPYFAVVALDRLQPRRRAPVGELVAEGRHASTRPAGGALGGRVPILKTAAVPPITFYLRMIFSENRSPLFGIMRCQWIQASRRLKEKLSE